MLPTTPKGFCHYVTTAVGSCRKTVRTHTQRKMGLQLNDIRQISKKGLNKGALSRAVRLQNRVKFHAETHVAANQVGGATADFLAFVKNLLPSDKYKMFTALMRYPLITNEVVSVCFDKLSRVFDGRNPVFSYNF